MPRAEPFVAEVSSDLEDLFHAADQEPLEEQFRADPQEQVAVERIVVGSKGPGGRPAVCRLQHRRLHFGEAAFFQQFAEDVDDGNALPEVRYRIGIGHQVQVPLAVAQFHVLKPVELLRHGVEALAKQREFLGPDGYLAGAGFLKRPGHRDEIAQVQQLRQLPLRFVQGILAEGDLHLPAAVADVGEHHLAHVADEYEPPCRVGGLAFGIVFVAAENVRDGLGGIVPHTVWLDPELADLLQLCCPVCLYFL